MAASPNNSNSVSQLEPDVAANYEVRKAEVTVHNDRYGRLQLGKGSSAANDTAGYDLSLVAGSIMYAGVADIAGGILFTDGEIITGSPVNVAFFDLDPGDLGRVRDDSPMFGPLQASASLG